MIFFSSFSFLLQEQLRSEFSAIAMEKKKAHTRGTKLVRDSLLAKFLNFN